ncbi:thioesterase II family protein [Streptomyces sp. TP-A0874]|uniref:thioesterase II family protein n=1 Tax=Streptomyces sp. TP-A0874 TaxID=549819 RepID=UPI000852F321|nr:alpha/beta fold hydrolase [Streptomyces sp. TP-A0874]
MTAVGTENKWFRRYPATGVLRKRLVVLPHAGGSATFYHSWGQAFGPNVEVLVVRYPGRQERLVEPCVESMGALADQVAAALLPLASQVPLALFGHSMGASCAYEVALRMENLYGVRLAGLYVSARSAPHRVSPKQTYLGGDEALLDEVRRLGGTDAELLTDPDLSELLMPAIRADFRIVGTYGPRPATPVRCPVTAYAGESDPAVEPADVAAWSEVAPAGFESKVLPGGHFYLLEQHDAVVGDLARRLDPGGSGE